jgi:hypothetical protein
VQIHPRGGFFRRKRGSDLGMRIGSKIAVVDRSSINSMRMVKMATQIVNKQEYVLD